MQTSTVHLVSPIGILAITASESFIHGIEFRAADHPFDPHQIPTPLQAECIEQLTDYLAGNLQQFSLPLQQSGTPFQQRVWQQLQTIPYGKTISYAGLSKQLGDVKAIRAVGTTNGKNQLAIVVPCHRVIGSDGSLTGYSGGLWRKQWLLALESKQANGVMELFA